MKTQDEYLRNMQQKIDEFGWGLQGVFPTVHDPDPGPSFTYTVGLTAYRKHPEFIVFGLGQAAGHLLNDLGGRVRDGQDFAAGQELTDLANMPCRLVHVVDVRPYMTITRRMFHGVRGLQLVWPDPEGRFPWEDGYSTNPKTQPLLGVWDG